MNTIILYSTKYGCTAACAELLRAGLAGSAVLTDIDKTDFRNISLETYDTVVLGSSIYVGSVSKKMRVFCKEYAELLCTKRVGIFICCGFSQKTDEYLSANFPEALLKSALAVADFGGEARMEKMSGIDRLIMKAAAKDMHESLKIRHDNIENFIKELNR